GRLEGVPGQASGRRHEHGRAVTALRSRRRVIVAAALALVAVAVTAIVVVAVSGGGASASDNGDNGTPTALATLRRQDLSSQTQVSATIGYAGAATISVPAGTAPADLRQAELADAQARAGLATAEAALTADRRGPKPDSSKIAADRVAIASAPTTLA